MKRESCLRFALSLAVVAAGLGVARAQHYADQLAASVNGEVITISEVEQVIRQRLADGHTPPERFEELRQEVLGMLIDDSLVRQYLSKNGPRVPDGDIQRWLSQLEGKLKTDGKTLVVVSELFPSKEALDAEGGGAADAMHETFGQLDELLVELASEY